MVKKHLKRLVAPRTWSIKKKENKFITRPNPGPHSLGKSITINLIVKDLLKQANTTKEVKKVLSGKNIFVDNKPITDHKFPLGLMDVISIPKTNEFFRILINTKGNFVLQPIKEQEASIKPCKIINKSILKKKKVQLNLFDGKNKIVQEDNYKVGDTIVLDLVKKEIQNHIKLEKGALVLLVNGKHIGKLAIVNKITEKPGSHNDTILLKTKNSEIETFKNYVFVIGKEKPVITLQENE